jgi:deoxyribodipyrimidine photo-lyase
MSNVDERRYRPRNEVSVGPGPVVYWMQRDQRVQDNWALLYAAEQAVARDVALMVIFNLVPRFGDTTARHYNFMFSGLEEVEAELTTLNIPFFLLEGEPAKTIPNFVAEHKVGEVVTDFNPLRFTDAWRKQVGEKLAVRFTEVDAHNIIPCWVVSDKEEFAAHTFRPKVHRQLAGWLVDFPKLEKQSHAAPKALGVDWAALRERVVTDESVLPVDWCTPGTKAGHEQLESFLDTGLGTYDENRNDPTLDGQSNLSPYLHFGQIAPQRVALAVKAKKGISAEAREAYLEELIVRRELTDNYCFYNPHYDQVAGAHEWAQKTIAEHADDEREYLYTKKQLEEGETHDELWNAMQAELVTRGKMHGWCRMYWAKKILEWTKDTQTAIDIALYLNDKYHLDGTDPNGVVGVMWSIAGVHDRAWTERPIFGKIRYMNFNGAKRKFDVPAYIAKYGNETTLFDS